jgi:hypothetical protein
MYCASCGSAIGDSALYCTRCGSAVALASNAVVFNPSKPHPGALVLQALEDAFRSLGRIAANPVGALAPLAQSLGARRALGAGLVFGAVYLCLAVLALQMLAPGGGAQGIDGTLVLLAAGMVPPLVLSLSATVVRRALHGLSSLGEEVFYATAALLPFGLAIVLGAALGVGRSDWAAVPLAFAGVIGALMLYAGITRITGVPESQAVLAVPVMALGTAWLTQVAVNVLVL